MDHSGDLTDNSDNDGSALPGDANRMPGPEAPKLLGQVDAQTARKMATIFRNSEDDASTYASGRSKRHVVARVSGFAEQYDEWKLAAGQWFQDIDLTPDLAENIGSRKWFRGLGTMIAFGALALALWPDMTPLEARAAMPDSPAIRDEFRSQMIMPLALGADSGRRMGPTPLVTPLESAPERPRIDLVATLAPGDSFASMLRRAGVSATDIGRISDMVGAAIPIEEIEPGTPIDISLGRRPAPGEARPLDALKFRARFDLELEISRLNADPETGEGGSLSLARNVIRVDETPLRVRGRVGSSLYRSMRASGVPASAVQDYLRALDDYVDLNREVRASDEFDIIIAYRRAATGERQAGKLLFAGLDRGGEPKTQLMRWGSDEQFFEASGVGEQRRGLVAPVPGPISSRYGMRRHPILGYRRMHAGLDFRARHGTPIVAVTDGRVSSAGRAGGCGIAVRLNHGSGLATRYCHMSRLAVRSGQQVRRGQVIGYVGSTGLSTGPHLHYEMYRNGQSINPASVDYVTKAVLSGSDLVEFRSQLTDLKTVEPGAALEDLVQLPSEVEEPVREIEKINLASRID